MRLLALACVALVAMALPAAPPPRLRAQTFDAVAKPLPLPYDERANGLAQVAAARARAKAANKRLLIDLGGNWCPDCRILAGAMELPDFKAWIRRHYEVVMVDVGRFDRNLAVPARYGITGRMTGVPSLLVVDPRTDRLLNPGTTADLADARRMNPQALANWLARWTR